MVAGERQNGPTRRNLPSTGLSRHSPHQNRPRWQVYNCRATGAIIKVAKIDQISKATGKRNTYEITAKGPQLTVVLNGTKTVEVQDEKLKNGPIALQHAPGADKKEGTIKFRKVEIKPM